MSVATATTALLFLSLQALPQAPEPAAPPVSSPFRPARPPLRFVFIGDYGTTSAESFALAALVRRIDPRFVLTLGDNNYPSGAADTIDENIGQHYRAFIHPYTGNYGEGALANQFFPCLGNHDWSATDAQPYLDYFELPGNERYYDFRRGALHFFALDSDPHEPDGITHDSPQAAWLEEGLAASSAPFKIVYMHHAPYSSSDVHGSQGPLQWPFREWGASIVLAGHDHLYERLSVSGLTYVVNGLGGRSFYDFGAPLDASVLRFNASPGVLLVEADEAFARFRFLTVGDSVQDEFVLPPGGTDPGTRELIPEDAVWQYLDTGIDPGPHWRSLAFDDSSWAAGRAQLGYGEGDEATVVSYGGVPTNRHITTWFRRTFHLPDPEEFETLQLRMLYDDGAVVYLNGVEVARARMPAGAIDSQTRAGSASGEEETRFDTFTFGPGKPFHVRRSLLVPSRNVLAVELHQASPSSNDLSFVAELVGVRRGEMLLPRASNWRYLDTGVDPDPAWKDPGFDDSHWLLGRAQLGFGEGDEATLVSTVNTTTWFRGTFEVGQASTVRWLSCRLLRDDGAIVYLNGREAVRFDLPSSGVTPATFASFNVGQEDEGAFQETSLDPRALVDGINTIAVELHQSSSTTGSDLSFDLELVAHRSVFEPRKPETGVDRRSRAR